MEFEKIKQKCNLKSAIKVTKPDMDGGSTNLRDIKKSS